MGVYGIDLYDLLDWQDGMSAQNRALCEKAIRKGKLARVMQDAIDKIYERAEEAGSDCVEVHVYRAMGAFAKWKGWARPHGADSFYIYEMTETMTKAFKKCEEEEPVLRFVTDIIFAAFEDDGIVLESESFAEGDYLEHTMRFSGF